jgi:excisionase family DNA binding protein
MNQPTNSPALTSSRDLQELLSIGQTTIYKLVAEGKLTPIRFSKRLVRYRLSEVQALIDAHATNGGAA